MNVVCENCKAPYSGPISPLSRFVKCSYCNSVIKISDERAFVTGKVFSIDSFGSYLVKRGIRTFDPVSGIIRLGNQEVSVSQDASVNGSEPLKTRVEKWILQFMSGD